MKHTTIMTIILLTLSILLIGCGTQEATQPTTQEVTQPEKTAAPAPSSSGGYEEVILDGDEAGFNQKSEQELMSRLQGCVKSRVITMATFSGEKVQLMSYTIEKSSGSCILDIDAGETSQICDVPLQQARAISTKDDLAKVMTEHCKPKEAP
ncbi:hypothetical protein ACFL3V_04475 [Nanoarchaeota archaeon]